MDDVVDVRIRISRVLNDRMEAILKRGLECTGVRTKPGRYIEDALADAVARDEPEKREEVPGES